MLYSSVIARFRPTKEMGERASERAEKRKRERQIELAGDRWSSPAVTQSYGGVHNVFPRARRRASTLIRSFSFYVDICPCLLLTLRSQVHPVPLHLHAFFCESDRRAIVRRTSIIFWRSFHDSFAPFGNREKVKQVVKSSAPRIRVSKLCWILRDDPRMKRRFNPALTRTRGGNLLAVLRSELRRRATRSRRTTCCTPNVWDPGWSMARNK